MNLPARFIILSPSDSLPLDGDEDINTAAEELTEQLADGPIAMKTKLIISATNGITNDGGGGHGGDDRRRGFKLRKIIRSRAYVLI